MALIHYRVFWLVPDARHIILDNRGQPITSGFETKYLAQNSWRKIVNVNQRNANKTPNFSVQDVLHDDFLIHQRRFLLS